MKIVGMAYGLPQSIAGESPFLLQQKAKLKSLTERRQTEVAALENLQHESAKGRAPGAALAAQIHAQQQRVLSMDVTAALIAGSMPVGGTSKRNKV